MCFAPSNPRRVAISLIPRRRPGGRNAPKSSEQPAGSYPRTRTLYLVATVSISIAESRWSERFGEQHTTHLWERFSLHYTPQHGSWLNQAEIEIV